MTSVPTQPIPKKSQQIKTDKPRPHICQVCTRAFARLEHLKRHERSHTNEKPYQCAACGRCFARRDLVLRHQQKLHLDLPNLVRRGLEISVLLLPSGTTPAAQNEHIIILTNNTSANAPLPKEDFYGSGQLPLPIPTTLLHDTPPEGDDKLPKKEESLKLTPNAIQGRHLEKLIGGHHRHNSFLAASGTNYAQLTPHDDVGHFDDKNLLLLGLDMEMSTFDWNNDMVLLDNQPPFNNLSQYFVENIDNQPQNLPPVPHRPRQLLISIGELEHLPHPKRVKVDVVDDGDDEWLHELILVEPEMVPLEEDVPTTNLLPLTLLFRTRQHDLREHTEAPSETYKFITPELRNHILLSISRTDSQFPSVDELNNYMKLYETEFNKYFPFIHLPLLKNPRVDNVENIPLLLAMCLIGALYLFAEDHPLLLFNLLKFHIQRFFESEIMADHHLRFNKVPLMAHQCLVLHIFVSLFLNEPNMVEVTQRQIKLMIGLIRLTRFNEPLEQFLLPPLPLAVLAPQYVQNRFDYFIMAQLRIRTLQVFYMVQTMRTAITGKQVLLNHTTLLLGTHCYPERLWQCQTALQLAMHLDEMGMTLVNIVDLSNGRLMDELIKLLRSTTTEPQLLLNNYMQLLIYINELLQNEVDDLQKQNPLGFNYFSWKLTHKPHMMALVRQWEQRFSSTGLPLTIDGHNKHLLLHHHELKLILPVHAYVHIRLEVNINEILRCVFYKQWDDMNAKLDALAILEATQDNCRQATPHALTIISLWLHNIELINYDIKQTALRTPVIFVVCILVALFVIHLYFVYLELLEVLSDNDLLNWFEMELMLLKVDKILTPLIKLRYSEKLLALGVFNLISGDHRVRNISNLISQKEVANVDMAEKLSREISGEVKRVELSTKLLYLGIRLLADAPVWPIALGISEAMKKRATYRSEKKVEVM